MGNPMKQVEKFDADYNKIYSQDVWTKEDIEMMKDLQKLMYYIEVRCAMKDGADYPGEQYMDEMGYNGNGYDSRSYDGYDNSYARGGYGRGNMGRSMAMQNGRPMPYGRNGMYGNGMSGRRYYDGEKDKAMSDLRRMMSMEQDPEKQAMIESAIHALEMK